MDYYNEPFILLSSIQPNSKGCIVFKEEKDKQDIINYIHSNNMRYKDEENKIIFENGSEIEIITPSKSEYIRGKRSKLPIIIDDFEACNLSDTLKELLK